MKTKLLALLLLVAIFTTMLCSCEIIKLANNILKFIPGNDSDNGDTNININIGGTTEHVHTETLIPAIESTCTEHGKTEGKKCLVCNEIIVPQEDAPLKAHTFDDDRDATCNNCTFVRDITCYHTHIEFLEAKESTCTETGLTEGRKCEDCGLILVAQEVISLKNHTAGDWTIDKNATTTEEGHKYLTCIVCKQIIEESIIPVVKEPSAGLEYTLNSDKKSYSLTGIGTCTDTYIVIPETYDGLPITTIGEKAFYGKNNIVGVFIPKYIQTIGTNAFNYCYSLAEVEFAHDSQLKTIEQSFGHCTSLKEIKIPSTVSNIWGYTFADCTSLETVIFPKKVKELQDRTFSGCKSLKNVYYEGTLEDWLSIKYSGYLNGDDGNPLCNGANLYIDNKLVTDVVVPDTIDTIETYAFEGCTSITSITIPTSVVKLNLNFSLSPNLKDLYYQGNIEDWCKVSHSSLSKVNLYFNGELVTDIVIPSSVTELKPNIFGGCTSLKSIVIPDSITIISDDAFWGCKSLTNVSIPNSVTTIGKNAFAECVSLANISLPKGLSNIGDYAFKGCTSLKSITIPEGITSIGKSAFIGNTSLTNAVIPDSVTIIDESAFEGCVLLTNVRIPTSIETIGTNAFKDCASILYNQFDNALYLGNENNPYVILIKAKDTSITSCQIHNDTITIEAEAFKDCTNLSNITIGNSVKTIGASSFMNCTSLNNVIIPDCVISINNSAFKGCTNLSNLTIGNSVKTIGISAFNNCTSLNNIVIPNSVTTIDQSAFCDCKSLTSITIPNSVTSLGNSVFYNCINLTNIELPDSINKIGTSAFYGCTSLKTIALPNGLSSIAESAFRECTSLTNITIPSSVTSIGTYAFANCTSLSNVTLNNNLKSINTWAFTGCTALKNIVIPKSVTTVYGYVFYGCNKSLKIYCEASSKPSKWNDNWNKCTPDTSYTATWGYTGN